MSLPPRFSFPIARAGEPACGNDGGTFSTTDPDSSNTFTYTFVSGLASADNWFVRRSAGTSLQTVASFDYEVKNSYSIRVRATDSGGLTYEQAFTITVTNINEAPAAIQLSSTSVSENQPAGTTVGPSARPTRTAASSPIAWSRAPAARTMAPLP